jgi:hypothetical protein
MVRIDKLDGVGWLAGVVTALAALVLPSCRSSAAAAADGAAAASVALVAAAIAAPIAAISATVTDAPPHPHDPTVVRFFTSRLHSLS